MDTPAPAKLRSPTTIGLLYAVGAFGVWGVFPIYLKALQFASPVEILCHRIVWSVVFVGAIAAFQGRVGAAFQEMRSLRRFWTYAATTLLVSANWLVFIWAVNNDHLLESSLGYFINPLVSVVLGMIFLGERLNRPQMAAVALAAIGVGYMALNAQSIWISLTLAFSFGVYMLIRKKARIDPLLGLLVETLLLAPFALFWLVRLGALDAGAFGMALGPSLLLALAGAFTALPLIWIAHAAQRLKLSTIGLMQYAAPTAQFLLAVLVYGEPFSADKLVTFAFIWAGLVVYSWDAFFAHRRRPAAAAAE